MVKNIMFKKGFSLAEALVSMLVLSVFFLATYKIMSQKEPEDVVTVPHGFFECYYENGILKQGYSYSGGTPKVEDAIGSCHFSPQKGVLDYSVTIIPANSGQVFSEQLFIDEAVEITLANGQSQPSFKVGSEDKTISNEMGTRDDFKDFLEDTLPNAHCMSTSSASVLIQW